MSRLKMILFFLCPVTLVITMILVLYTRSILNSGTTEIKNQLVRSVDEYAIKIQLVMREISKQVKMDADLLSEFRNKPSQEYFEHQLNSFPFLYAIGIAYAPEFLKDLRENKYPEYKLPDYHSNNKELVSKIVPGNLCLILHQKTEENLFVWSDISGTDYTTSDWYLLAELAGKGCWSDQFLSELESLQVYAYSCPFYYKGNFAGVIFGKIKIDIYKKELASLDTDRLSSKYGGSYYILGDNGKTLFNSKTERIDSEGIYSYADSIGQRNLYSQLDTLLSEKSGVLRLENWVSTDSTDKQLRPFWLIFTQLRSDMSFTLVATFDENLVLNSLHKRLFIIWITGILVMILLGMIISGVFMRLFHPVYEMTRVARQVMNGNLNARVCTEKLNPRSDLGILAVDFNNMIANLNQYLNRTIEEATRREVLERNLDIARDIQQSFLPFNWQHNPADSDFWLDVALEPAKEVAGDFFDYWTMNENNIAFLIADVSGKGVPAAMIMIAVRTLIRQESELSNDPGKIISAVNKTWVPSNKKGMFVTLFFGVCNIPTEKIHYTNAGHNPPILAKENSEPRFMEEPGNPVLGIFPDYEFSTKSISLDEGDALFLYTDGVTEATAENGDLFGEDRLLKNVKDLMTVPKEQEIKRFLNILKDFSGSKQQDDITVMILKHLEKNKDDTPCQ